MLPCGLLQVRACQNQLDLPANSAEDIVLFSPFARSWPVCSQLQEHEPSCCYYCPLANSTNVLF
jgi:hypothetical protein